MLYSNTEQASVYLTRSSPSSLYQSIQYSSRTIYLCWHHLTDAVRSVHIHMQAGVSLSLAKLQSMCLFTLYKQIYFVFCAQTEMDFGLVVMTVFTVADKSSSSVRKHRQSGADGHQIKASGSKLLIGFCESGNMSGLESRRRL